jgi:hypothetical protein
MSKKDFSQHARDTVASEKKVLEQRLKDADSILLGGTRSLTEKKRSSRVVRDTFSMPPDDYGRIDELRTRAALLGRITTKSELVRAGLHALLALGDAEFLKAINQLERVLPGRKG